MGDVKLFFVLRGWRLDQSLRVTIPRGDDVFDLKLLIISACGDVLRRVPVNHVDLYRVSIDNGDDLARVNLADNPPLSPRDIIGTLFPDHPERNEYILVVVSSAEGGVGEQSDDDATAAGKRRLPGTFIFHPSSAFRF